MLSLALRSNSQTLPSLLYTLLLASTVNVGDLSADSMRIVPEHTTMSDIPAPSLTFDVVSYISAEVASRLRRSSHARCCVVANAEVVSNCERSSDARQSQDGDFFLDSVEMINEGTGDCSSPAIKGSGKSPVVLYERVKRRNAYQYLRRWLLL